LTLSPSTAAAKSNRRGSTGTTTICANTSFLPHISSAPSIARISAQAEVRGVSSSCYTAALLLLLCLLLPAADAQHRRRRIARERVIESRVRSQSPPRWVSLRDRGRG
jgi:hypothetical protein